LIDLDSSTEKKYSHHLIVPRIWFKDNIECGHFVKFMVSQLQYASQLFVMNDKGKQVSIIDLGVYTRNRNFRIYGSSKFGKGTPLVISKGNQFPFVDEEELFFASLLCKLPSSQIKPELFTFNTENQEKSSDKKFKKEKNPSKNRNLKSFSLSTH